MRRTLLGLVLLTAVATACGSDSPDTLSGIVRQPPPSVADISLPDASTGGRFTTVASPGNLLVVYFGYTSCPDICPTTLADLRSALRSLGEDADQIDVAVTTVDPGRDDAQRLTDYVQSFFPGGHALRTDDPDELADAADAFGVSYQVTETEDGEIEVEHSAYLYAVDDQGLIRLQWSFGTSVDDLQNDLALLLAGQD